MTNVIKITFWNDITHQCDIPSDITLSPTFIQNSISRIKQII